MVTGSEILGAAQGLKIAFDILQGLNATAKAAAINEVKVKLTQHIIEAQQALTAAGIAQANAAETIRNLEQRIVQFENWEADKQRYELADTGKGSLAYRLKVGMEQGEPPHWLCPGCYQQGQKSIMKHDHLPKGRVSVLECNRCALQLVTAGHRVDDPPRAGAWGRGRS